MYWQHRGTPERLFDGNKVQLSISITMFQVFFCLPRSTDEDKESPHTVAIDSFLYLFTLFPSPRIAVLDNLEFPRPRDLSNRDGTDGRFPQSLHTMTCTREC